MTEQEKKELRLIIRTTIDDVAAIQDSLRHLTVTIKSLIDKVFTEKESKENCKCGCCKH